MAAEFNRDRWGRPLIIPDGGGKPLPYGRFSSHGSVLEDKFALEKWKIRTSAIGLTKREDLFAQLAACPADDSKRLDEIMSQALEAGGGSVGANLGTALHEFTQRVDLGELNVDDIAEPWKSDVQAYLDTLDKFNLVLVHDLIEVNLVNDDLQLAGTADRFYLDSNMRLICADIKTGKQISKNPLAYAVQLAAYANSLLYDIETGTRKSPGDVCLDYGYIMHIPANQGRCDIYEVDLREAMEAARLASTVKRWQKRSDLVKPLTPAYKPKKTLSDAPGSSVSPVNQDRNSWVRRRLQPVIEAAKADLVALWPDSILTPSKAEIWSDPEIDEICVILSSLETAYQLPFSEPDPTAPKPVLAQFSFEKKTIDECGPADNRLLDDIKKRLQTLPKPQLDFVQQIIADATAGKASISLKQKKTLRRATIISALITLSELVGTDNEDIELIRTIVSHVRSPLPDQPIGHIVGTFTFIEAERLQQLAQQIHAGETVIRFEDDGSITFKEVK